MPAEHMRPTGLSQGYFCYTCGMHCNMVGSGHGKGLCESNPTLVAELIKLNQKDSVMKQPTLGEKLAKTIDELDTANIKALAEKAAADLAKIRRERQELFNLVDDFRQYLINTIVAEKVPSKKVTGYDRQNWIREAVKGTAPHQDIWNGLRDWAREQQLVVIAREEHDGMGMESWITLTAEPVRRGNRSVDK